LLDIILVAYILYFYIDMPFFLFILILSWTHWSIVLHQLQ